MTPVGSDLHGRIERIATLQRQLHDELGERAFDDLAMAKSVALRAKLEGLGIDRARQVCLGHLLRHAVPADGARTYLALPPDFLDAEVDPVPPRSVVLLLNNDIGARLPQWMAWVARRPDCLHVVWDWDSQHWLQMSCTLAATADVYVPSTSENLYTLSHFNPHLLGPAFAAVHQWSRRFLVEHMDVLLAERSDDPFGPHVLYASFPRRNRAVATLHRSFAGISLTDHQYQRKSDLENLVEWARYKVHWIMPVLGGVPIRVYNGLITGGIPVLPTHVAHMPERMAVGRHAEYYDVIDLVTPAAVQQRAVQRFDAAGAAGLVERIGEALAQHHVDTRCEQVLAALDRCIAARLAGGAPTSGDYLMRG